MVLIVAREFDPSVDAIVVELGRRGVPVFRTDLSAFPTTLQLDARLVNGRWAGRLSTGRRTVSLADIRSIWRRNPRAYGISAELTEQDAAFAYREAKLGLGGVLGAPDALWVNHPHRCADAVWKPWQWSTAAA